MVETLPLLECRNVRKPFDAPTADARTIAHLMPQASAIDGPRAPIFRARTLVDVAPQLTVLPAMATPLIAVGSSGLRRFLAHR